MLGRAAARDLYDVHNMIRFGLFDESELPMLRKCVVFYTAISQDEIPEEYDLNRMRAISSRKIKTDLLPVIKKGEFVELESIKKEVMEYLTGLLRLTADEKEFLTRFSNKRYAPELLFDDPSILARIAEHPMAVWKKREA